MKDNKIIFIAEMPQGGSYEKGNLEELRNAIICDYAENDNLIRLPVKLLKYVNDEEQELSQEALTKFNNGLEDEIEEVREDIKDNTNELRDLESDYYSIIL
jgi:hypothetical protein